jgi:hypothetical protein
MTSRVQQLVQTLGLQAHPEGGWFREVHRDAAVTTIHYVLDAGALSPLHRLRTRTELWHFYGGTPLELHTIAGGRHAVTALSPESPVAVVPAGAWQAARAGDGWAWCGCTVAPAFDFADWEMPSRETLLRELPSLTAIVTGLTRA